MTETNHSVEILAKSPIESLFQKSPELQEAYQPIATAKETIHTEVFALITRIQELIAKITQLTAITFEKPAYPEIESQIRQIKTNFNQNIASVLIEELTVFNQNLMAALAQTRTNPSNGETEIVPRSLSSTLQELKEIPDLPTELQTLINQFSAAHQQNIATFTFAALKANQHRYLTKLYSTKPADFERQAQKSAINRYLFFKHAKTPDIDPIEQALIREQIQKHIAELNNTISAQISRLGNRVQISSVSSPSLSEMSLDSLFEHYRSLYRTRNYLLNFTANNHNVPAVIEIPIYEKTSNETDQTVSDKIVSPEAIFNFRIPKTAKEIRVWADQQIALFHNQFGIEISLREIVEAVFRAAGLNSYRPSNLVYGTAGTLSDSEQQQVSEFYRRFVFSKIDTAQSQASPPSTDVTTAHRPKITLEELAAEIQAGKSIADIAAEREVTPTRIYQLRKLLPGFESDQRQFTSVENVKKAHAALRAQQQ